MVLATVLVVAASLAAPSVLDVAVPSPKPGPKPPVPVPPSPPATGALGLNLSSPNYYMQDRALMNLAQGATWGSQKPGVSGWQPFNPLQIDANGNIISLLPGEIGHLMLIPPEGAMGTSPTRIRCTWAGKGSLTAGGSVIGVSRSGGSSVEFNWVPSGAAKAKTAWLSLSQTDKADPLRQIDCREKSASPTDLFSPAFLEQLKGYQLLRFMDWQYTNANEPVTWATRVTPQTLSQAGKLGMSIEYMVALANQTKADAWFCMPWNADEDFVRRFAMYVRDNLAADRKVYVEMSNEVWNFGFPVTKQAQAEGLARGLSKDPSEALLRRYAEKSTWMNKIWADVFKAQPTRLVRLISTQNANPWVAEQVLKYADTAANVDGLATAPYFGHATFAGPRKGVTDLNNIFAFLNADVDATIAKAMANKAAARRYGKRYIAYEGGQHIVNPDEVPLVAAINRDQRMYGVYKKYLAAWRTQIGDVMTLFNSTGPISRYGAWGMREYSGQPMAETPKRRAAVEYIGVAAASDSATSE
ncbi:hypothetical protein ACFB49_03990 [Sphingomonas sp. DBB INV C78]|uniref:hypothetical protein n=1 Tax=Sphingomonas sp. DBB INV C78 TaxID=3349434 RepID=UPI0036D3E93C